MEKLFHHFFAKLGHAAIPYIFDNVTTLAQFIKKLENATHFNQDWFVLFGGSTERDPNRGHNVFQGDGFEAFVEAFAIRFGDYYNIKNYKPNISSDTGIDGIGIHAKTGLPMTFQVKKRNVIHELKAKELATFTSSSMLRFKEYGVQPRAMYEERCSSQERLTIYDQFIKKGRNWPNHMIVFTSGKGVHEFTKEEMFRNEVSCIGAEEISNRVDGNTAFWEAFKKLAEQQATNSKNIDQYFTFINGVFVNDHSQKPIDQRLESILNQDGFKPEYTDGLRVLIRTTKYPETIMIPSTNSVSWFKS